MVRGEGMKKKEQGRIRVYTSRVRMYSDDEVEDYLNILL